MFDKLKEDLRETVTGSNPENDLRARLHADHVEVDRLIGELQDSEDHELAMRADLRDELVQALIVHSRAEEDVVYTRLRSEPSLRADVTHSDREHQDILTALARLEALDPADPAFLDALNQLADTVKHHVHEEEGTVLPKAQERLGQDVLARLIPPFNERKRELLQQHHSALETAPTLAEPTPTPVMGRGLADAPSQW
ncbi:MAG: hemerythrin domain-containing protein [Bryobacterales bacterium]